MSGLVRHGLWLLLPLLAAAVVVSDPWLSLRLGLPDLALDILLMDTGKNSYVVSGNNFQRSRADLPLYLPGNGTLLLAAAMMCAGYDGCESDTPGFPRDGRWSVRYEDINQLP